jgi:diadenosine tetraphosphate (Ap4A) HIT family hydrolase
VLPAIILAFVLADARNCACDVGKPETMQATNCSLCREAEKQPANQGVFFLKDANPSKANRTLALPRKHSPGPHSLNDLSDAERTELWSAAIAKAKELWGNQWGIAYNGEERRTQCHAHVHIGKLIDDAETGHDFVVVSSPEEIQVPTDGSGLWLHEVDGKIHVHAGAQVNETVLVR